MSWAQAAMFLLGEGLKNQQRSSQPVKTGNQHLLGNRPYSSLAPNNRENVRSLLTMPPIGYQASSSGNFIPAAPLDGVGVGIGGGLSMADPQTTAMIGNKATSEEQDNNEVQDTSAMDEAMEEKRKAAIEVQKMADKNALIRQGISSAGTLLGTLMRPPPAITTGGGIRRNPPLQMYRRRRGLMSG